MGKSIEWTWVGGFPANSLFMRWMFSLDQRPVLGKVSSTKRSAFAHTHSADLFHFLSCPPCSFLLFTLLMSGRIGHERAGSSAFFSPSTRGREMINKRYA